MKTLPIIALFIFLLGSAAIAQSSNDKSNYPYYTISKDVLKIQYKNVEHMPAKIILVSPSLTQLKGSVQILNKKEISEKRQLVRVGYPSWTISKGVARRQFEKSQSR